MRILGIQLHDKHGDGRFRSTDELPDRVPSIYAHRMSQDWYLFVSYYEWDRKGTHVELGNTGATPEEAEARLRDTLRRFSPVLLEKIEAMASKEVAA